METQFCNQYVPNMSQWGLHRRHFMIDLKAWKVQMILNPILESQHFFSRIFPLKLWVYPCFPYLEILFLNNGLNLHTAWLKIFLKTRLQIARSCQYPCQIISSITTSHKYCYKWLVKCIPSPNTPRLIQEFLASNIV